MSYIKIIWKKMKNKNKTQINNRWNNNKITNNNNNNYLNNISKLFLF